MKRDIKKKKKMTVWCEESFLWPLSVFLSPWPSLLSHSHSLWLLSSPRQEPLCFQLLLPRRQETKGMANTCENILKENKRTFILCQFLQGECAFGYIVIRRAALVTDVHTVHTVSAVMFEQ